MKNTYNDYIQYCEDKMEINELPLTFNEWQEFNEYGSE